MQFSFALLAMMPSALLTSLCNLPFVDALSRVRETIVIELMGAKSIIGITQ